MQFWEISCDEEISFGIARFPQGTGDLEDMKVGIENEFGNQSDPIAFCQMFIKMHFSNRCEKKTLSCCLRYSMLPLAMLHGSRALLYGIIFRFVSFGFS